MENKLQVGKPDGLVIVSYKSFFLRTSNHGSPCQMMSGWGVQNHLRNARYLGSMKPLGDGIPRVLGTRLGSATPFF